MSAMSPIEDLLNGTELAHLDPMAAARFSIGFGHPHHGLGSLQLGLQLFGPLPPSDLPIVPLLVETGPMKALNLVANETYPANFTQGITITIAGVAGQRTITYAP